jgi:predicted chitinase
LNATIRKYLLNTSSERLALFLAQTYIETDRWKTFREYGKGASNAAIPMAQYYAAFYGRGIMQLTWASAYEKYGEFKQLPNVEGAYDGEPRITQTSLHYWDDPTKRDANRRIIGVVGTPKRWAKRFNPDSVANESILACDSGGFFWVWKHHTGTRNISRVADWGFSEVTIDKINKLVNGGSFGYFERFVFSFYTRNILTDWLPGEGDLIVTTPKHTRVKVDLSKP